MSNYQVETPVVHQLTVASSFNRLNSREKLYAHYMSRAAWCGSKIVLRQVSEESPLIFEFINELARSLSGDWDKLVNDRILDEAELTKVLEYFATFLSNLGNYYGEGDQKFIPAVEEGVFKKIAETAPKAEAIYNQISHSIFSLPPYGLGFPCDQASSGYYPGETHISQQEIARISQALAQRDIHPENTRIRKRVSNDCIRYEVLQASVEQGPDILTFQCFEDDELVSVVRGDHSVELSAMCHHLEHALAYAANDSQARSIRAYIQSFQTGDLELYRDSQRSWITDKSPTVENIFGFVEPYRDPYGVRAEFEALVAINDPQRTRLLYAVVENSDHFIKWLPWTEGETENEGKGPFEKSLLDSPDLSSIHTLAYCSSIIFYGINLPNYNDIRQDYGFKNVIVENQMTAPRSKAQFLDPTIRHAFKKAEFHCYYLWVVAHEILGHGTGQLMMEISSGRYNFDIDHPPISPITKEPIKSWYKLGQTWTGQFQDLSTTVDECRCELVGVYMMDNPEFLRLFGFDEKSELNALDLTYYTYQLLVGWGLASLANYNTESQQWGQAHSRGRFAMLTCLLRDSQGCVKVTCNQEEGTVQATVDKESFLKRAKPALGQMLLRLHIFRSTADVAACREYYEDLSRVDGDILVWREAVLRMKEPQLIHSQPNSFIEGDNVSLKEYAPTIKGVLESWLDRNI